MQEITTVGVDFAKSVFTTKDEVAKLDGFDKAFTQADRNKGDKLDQDEVKVACALYTGNPQS